LQTVLVTGGRGYVGRRLVARLVAAGHAVVRYDRDHFEADGGAAQAQGELYDVPRLLAVISEHGVDAIVHTAAISHPDVSVAMPVATFESNVTGTVALYEAARMAGVGRVVNLSSSSVYGHADGAVREDRALRPITPYGVTKVATDLLGGVYRELYRTEVVSIRLTWVYGPGNRMPEHVRDLVRAGLRGEPYRLASGADHPLPLIHVEDAAAGIAAALLAPAVPQPAYNIAGDGSPALGEVAQRVRELIPEADIEIGPGDLPLHRLGPIDTSAAERDLGYRPEWPLERGLPDYVEWLREHEA
jgi:nucleoside-diphosphate-sugar epimerase